MAKKTKKNNVHPSLDAVKVKQRQGQLKALSTSVQAAMKLHGILGDGCQTVCEDEIVIGPDGQPHHETVCRTICS